MTPATLHRGLGAALIIGMSSLLLVGCSGSSGGAPMASTAAPAAGGEALPAPAPQRNQVGLESSAHYETSDEYGDSSEADAESEAPATAPLTLQRQIARAAAVGLVVTDLAKAAADLGRVATAMGGVVTSESLNLPGEPDSQSHSSRVVITVPSNRLDETLTLIGSLGRVAQRDISSDDVTDSVVDVAARVKTMRESITRLQALMKRAGSVSAIAEVESELTSRQEEYESLLARQQALSAQVATSPVSVNLSTEAKEEPKPDPEPQSGFLVGLISGWQAMAASAVVSLTVIGAVLPWLVLAALVVVPVLVVRRRRKASAAAATASAESVTDQPVTTDPPSES